LDGNVAVLSGAHLSGEVDASCPHVGMRLHGTDAPLLTARILGVDRCLEEPSSHVIEGTAAAWPLRTAEFYVRGDDLVASYEPATDWPFSPQLYWQAGPLRQLVGVRASLSLLVSVQTQLLDTCPRIGVASQLPPGEVLLISSSETDGNRSEVITDRRDVQEPVEVSCVVVRLRECQITYVEIAAPSDFHELHVRAEDSGASIEWRLFSEFLEKGVIRRARVHAALLPRQSDIDLAVACCEATKRLQLPLTT
jgi:hypothetical protein